MKKKQTMRAGAPGRTSKRSPTAAKVAPKREYRLDDLSDFAARLGCRVQVAIEPREVVEQRERLAAASGDLLHACALALDCVDRFDGHLSVGAVETLKRAIAKATGK